MDFLVCVHNILPTSRNICFLFIIFSLSIFSSSDFCFQFVNTISVSNSCFQLFFVQFLFPIFLQLCSQFYSNSVPNLRFPSTTGQEVTNVARCHLPMPPSSPTQVSNLCCPTTLCQILSTAACRDKYRFEYKYFGVICLS